MGNILELNHTDALLFFLKGESYFNFDLPSYFVFETLIQAVSTQMTGQDLSSFYLTYTTQGGQQKKRFPNEFEEVNYKFLNNKDGKFAWRPFQLIHPALYVSLIHAITEPTNWGLIVARFGQFQENKNIRCYSIPVYSDTNQSDKASTVSQWWQTIEQQSIELALKYEYVLHTDISDCYGSIYTHSVPWAVHTKPTAKTRRRDLSLIGNSIDKHLQDMSYGQTNGIPQGSVLMDFIAEMVLGFADMELSERIQKDNLQDYEIIRYRDDYRIFSNNPQIAEHITKLLTEILIELGMRLNAQKTIVSNNVVRDAIKPDKLYWILAKRGSKNLQEHLFIIHRLSEEYPNSGSLSKALLKFYDRIKGITKTMQNIKVLTSILADVMYKNPRTYPIATAILSKLLSLIEESSERNEILSLICLKFEKIPNTAHIKIWLQRLTIKIDRQRVYEEILCGKVNDPAIQIWNSDWLENNLKTLIERIPIIDEEVISDIDVVIESDEVELFKDEYSYSERTEE
ncbi:RNA-directed DNA polymerase [Chitinophaga ginsengisegetis]|uniref:RNA-directed DNA polymerase n=1 Tax=Chitinophaga ginsengisegetis TaxID=393003 RepID=UPI00343708C6